LRALNNFHCDKIVFSGGPTKGVGSEADEMAALAVTFGLDSTLLVRETQSYSTWTNVEFSAKLIGKADYVVLASDGMHASRARHYWLQQHPESNTAVIVANDYKFLDRFWLKVPIAAIEAQRMIRDAIHSPYSRKN
jgi:uncharacterized SAM-binding protein YcdF (DUF218 family)